jgi:hypothetical protein
VKNSFFKKKLAKHALSILKELNLIYVCFSLNLFHIIYNNVLSLMKLNLAEPLYIFYNVKVKKLTFEILITLIKK